MSTPAPAQVRTFEPAPVSVRHARRFVSEALGDLGAPVATEKAALLVSELVTNAVLHARTPITLQVAVDEAVRVWVCDESSALPSMRSFTATAGSGRGLHLVAAIAARWGVERSESRNGKCVWFELPVVDDDPDDTVTFDYEGIESI